MVTDNFAIFFIVDLQSKKLLQISKIGCGEMKERLLAQYLPHLRKFGVIGKCTKVRLLLRPVAVI